MGASASVPGGVPIRASRPRRIRAIPVAIVPDGSSALIPSTRVDSPCRRQPAMMPAWVPPDEVDSRITSGGAICVSSSVTAMAYAAAPRGVEAPSGITNGRRPFARSSAAASSMPGARASPDST